MIPLSLVICYGKTECHLNVRSSEHIGISHLAGKRIESKPSAVSDHLLLHNHDVDSNDFAILCRENNGFRLLLKESFLISRDSPVWRPIAANQKKKIKTTKINKIKLKKIKIKKLKK